VILGSDTNSKYNTKKSKQCFAEADPLMKKIEAEK
jgi:hypothetical protein